ncbi:type II toxin-antitoxin system RelE/ParE family toxin [Pediococcus acidilactici]|uniref:type II toxin-antitoxin system RelE/ParE family toxin n=1 Tax=Pediococcus acidilactici TaxID=1254 RepID=UPI0003272035|nr:type II toxin-antitoxin system RelE/ParE family toxin [Pediococcus acidilactici]EOA07657.1 addiction module killer protein [Pediococcus acidilactici D3]MBW4798196.1 type II toxin-antitoxin system RelE/ParE family toxin [Pediococcus acidilactici]MBW9307432.1 type II toxin-antitoxin system RelE/ParE family toxin [Pediococcus acidilactici]MCE5962989.1 type II toxin-antitoxin system RelE/ParE family toxin [Pediococcus acidilactici]MCW8083950.1 type II toxin-antitoxin system RelE/ParE family tox
MEDIEFESYKRNNGHDEFLEFIEQLPIKDQQKLLEVIELTQEKGLLIAQKMKWIKKLDDNLFELRSKVSSNIQRVLYFHVVNGRYVITHGFTKKTQTTPQREIKHAKQIREEWFNEN